MILKNFEFVTAFRASILIYWHLLFLETNNYIRKKPKVNTKKLLDFQILILKKEENGIITHAKFKTFGCGAAITSSSIATQMIKGKSVEEATKLINQAVVEALRGLPPVKIEPFQL